LWDVAAHRPIGRLAGQSGPVNSVAFSPDGKTLASGSTDGTVLLWDVATHQPIGAPLTGQNASIFSVVFSASVAFSPDGNILASGNNDGTVRLWDVATHHQIGNPLIGHIGPVHSVAFSPDGKTLASGSTDQTVRFWRVAAPRQKMANAADLARYLCALTGRSLTHAEWARWVPGLAYQQVCP
jgi:WD40 repeat protein